MTRVLIEATGSLTSGYVVQKLNECGATIIGSDISTENHGKCLCDEFIQMPPSNTPNIQDYFRKCIKDKQIDLVIPSLDETLLDWALISDTNNTRTSISISPARTIKIFRDKWKTYEFFKDIGVATPHTSLSPDYSFFKPRDGRGSSGIFTDEKLTVMPDNYISQDFITGTEYTVDCLFSTEGKLVYCVPRERLQIISGKSLSGITVNRKNIIDEVDKISRETKFEGMINFQCIENQDGVFFLEANPRLAGGMALGIAATENWLELIIKNVIYNSPIASSCEPIFPLKMYRYYNEIFTG